MRILTLLPFFAASAFASSHYVKFQGCSPELTPLSESSSAYDIFFEDALLLIDDLGSILKSSEDWRSFNRLGVVTPKSFVEAAGLNYRGIQERALQTRYGHLLAHALRAAVFGSVITGQPEVAVGIVREVKKQVDKNQPQELVDSNHVLLEALIAVLPEFHSEELRLGYLEAIKATIASGLFLPIHSR